jgi:hypothetical protein
VETTAIGVAAPIADAIVERTNVLLARLAEQGFARTHPDWTRADECLLECVLFEWFLRDLAMSYGSERETTSIRAALAGRVLINLQRSGLSTDSLGDFDRRHRERFAEYTFSTGLGASLRPLGALPWRRISGNDQPSERMTMLLATRASAPGGAVVEAPAVRDTLSPLDYRQDIGEVVGPDGPVGAGGEGVPPRIVLEGMKGVRSACEDDPV